MFCKHCGSNLPEGASFCVTCGKKISVESTYGATDGQGYTYAQNDFNFNNGADVSFEIAPTAPVRDEARDAHGGKILTLAILALAFSLSFYLAFIGTVFFILCKVQLGKYLAKYGETEGRASVGKALSIAALPVNIVMVVCLTLILIALLLA